MFFCISCESVTFNKFQLCQRCSDSFFKICRQNDSNTEASEFHSVFTLEQQNFIRLSLFDWSKNNDQFCRNLILSLKNSGPQNFWTLAASLMAHKIRKQIGAAIERYKILPCPLKGDKLCTNNHALQFAKALSLEIQIPMIANLLCFEAQSLGQKVLTKQQRFKRKAIPIYPLERKYPYILFVDDVITTGASALASYKALIKPKEFIICSLAHRPLLENFNKN